MLASEFYSYQEAGNGKSFVLEEDPFEAEETLSLSDLPIHSDSAHWDDYSKEDGQSSASDSEDFFEFFSEDFTASTAPEKDIIFCGKIISSHVPLQKGQSFERNTKQSSETQKQGVLLPWKSSSGTVKSCDSSFNNGQVVKDSKSNLKCDRYSVGKLSLLRSTTKSRWYLFLFGMSRLPTEMELKDIRSRQSRRGPSAMFPAPEGGEGVVNKSKGRRNSKGLLGKMKRSLGFGRSNSKHANDVVKG